MSEQTHNIAVEQPAEGDPDATTGSVETPETSTTGADEPTPDVATDTETAVTAETPEATDDSTPVATETAGRGAEDSADGDLEGDADAEEPEDGADSEEDGDEEDGDEEDGDPLDTEGEIAADYLEELLDIADLDGDIDTYVESGRAHVSVVTDSQVLVGKDGEVLESLQDLVRLAVVAETGHRSRLMLDIAGHREKRRRELVDLATDAVQEVRTSSEAVRLSPMNPFERKIVHDAVAAAGLTSESEGEEPQRRVVVMP